MEALKKRRSIRVFEPGRAVEREKIDQMIEAAQFAPSARNGRPWHFVVIEDRDKLNHIAEKNPSTGMLRGAPLAILVCADTELSPIFWTGDCGAATQNLLLSAHEMGIGTCWCAAHGFPELEALFADVCKLPPNVKPFACIAVGYPAQQPASPDRADPSRVHNNTF